MKVLEPLSAMNERAVCRGVGGYSGGGLGGMGVCGTGLQFQVSSVTKSKKEAPTEIELILQVEKRIRVCHRALPPRQS